MDIRTRLNSIVDGIDNDVLESLVHEMLDARKLKWAHCPKCHERVQVETPDIDKIAKILPVLLDQAKGKPAETKKVTVDVGLRSVKELTDSELEQIVAGSLPELPPAA